MISVIILILSAYCSMYLCFVFMYTFSFFFLVIGFDCNFITEISGLDLGDR